MPYIAQAILVVLLAIGGFTAAIWTHLRNRPRLSLAFLLATALFLRLFSASSHYLHPWDERYHALVAKHLIEHPLVPTLYDPAILTYDPADWEANHIWLHKPPLSLWLIALSLKLFGTTPFAVRIPSIFLSTLGIALTYGIARRLFDNRIAFFAALFHALSGILMAQSSGWFSTDHPDTMFIFFIELGVFFSVLQRGKFRWRYVILAGIAMGLALLSKWAAAFVILPVWLALMWDRRPFWKTAAAGLIMFAIAVAMAAPWQIYTSRTFPTEYRIESSYNWKHLSTAVEDHDNGVFYHLFKAYDFYGILVYPAIIVAAILFFKKRLPRGAGPVLVWFTLTYAVFTFAATKMGGYVLIAAPAVFILMALVLAFLQDAIARREGGRPWADAIFVAFAITAGVPIVQRLNLFNHIPPEPSWAAALRSVEHQLPSTPTVIFNDPHPIETMFDTNAIAYEALPTTDDLHTVSAAGFAIVIIREQGEPPAIIPSDNARILEASADLWEK
jgi:4-amino-4-deoxy-L-arabinose transferase-like glycosyltransferase